MVLRIIVIIAIIIIKSVPNNSSPTSASAINGSRGSSVGVGIVVGGTCVVVEGGDAFIGKNHAAIIHGVRIEGEQEKEGG